MVLSGAVASARSQPSSSMVLRVPETDGLVVSSILTVWVAVVELPHSSVMVYVLVTVPEQPGSAESPTWVTVTAPPQLSDSPVTSLTSAAGMSA